MYKVPADLDLRAFDGTTLEQVVIGSHQIVFHFDPQGSIAIEGTWELRDQHGAVIDRSLEPSEREAYRVHSCLGRRVLSARVESSSSIVLTFDSGHVLRVMDDSDQYESFHIQPGDIHI
jgi:hypothetical protein